MRVNPASHLIGLVCHCSAMLSFFLTDGAMCVWLFVCDCVCVCVSAVVELCWGLCSAAEDLVGRSALCGFRTGFTSCFWSGDDDDDDDGGGGCKDAADVTGTIFRTSAAVCGEETPAQHVVVCHVLHVSPVFRANHQNERFYIKFYFAHFWMNLFLKHLMSLTWLMNITDKRIALIWFLLCLFYCQLTCVCVVEYMLSYDCHDLCLCFYV